VVALISFLVVVALSVLVERTATVALTLTGLSREAARFQARSAFSGTGFTTGEAEQLVRHPVRRRIVDLLMLVRSFGLLTAASSLVLSFVDTAGPAERATRALLLVVGLLGLGLLAVSPWIDRHLSKLIAAALRRWTDLDVRDYTALLGLENGHAVLELPVGSDGWLAGKRLDELSLPEEGVLVLAVRRADGSFTGAPRGHSVLNPEDTVILYGRAEHLADIDARPGGHRGDEAHREAVWAERLILEREEARARTAALAEAAAIAPARPGPAGDPRPVPERGRRPDGVHHTPSGGEACATGV